VRQNADLTIGFHSWRCKAFMLTFRTPLLSQSVFAEFSDLIKSLLDKELENPFCDRKTKIPKKQKFVVVTLQGAESGFMSTDRWFAIANHLPIMP